MATKTITLSLKPEPNKAAVATIEAPPAHSLNKDLAEEEQDPKKAQIM